MRQKRVGFTLIELLLVIGIIAVLASIVILSINPLNKVRKTVVVVPLSTSAPEIEFLNALFLKIYTLDSLRDSCHHFIGYRLGQIRQDLHR